MSRRQKLLVFSAVLVSSLVAQATNHADLAPRALAQGSDPSADVRRAAELAVVAIQARIGRDDVRSSGVVIDAERGLVLTTTHSIWGAKSLRVATGLAVLFGRVVARDACDDLALIELQPRVPGLEALITRTAPRDVAWVEALGRRFTAPARGRESLVRVPARLERGSENPRPRALPLAPDVVALDSPLVPEATGAALLDDDGQFWGLAQVVAPPRQPARAFAIPTGLIQGRLDELQPGARTVYVGWRERQRCAPRLHAYNREAHPGFSPSDARFNAPVPATRLPGAEELNRP